MAATNLHVLIVGKGGREFALASHAVKSPIVHKVSAFVPMQALPETFRPIGFEKFQFLGVTEPKNNSEWVALAQKIAPDLVIIGPDQNLADGLADEFQEIGIPAFGPSRAASEIEWSKDFAKTIMKKAAIPTADFFTVTDAESGIHFVREHCQKTWVVKVDELALGKGVVVPANLAETESAIQDFFSGKLLGTPARKIVLEEKLTGPEVSAFYFACGRDFKKIATVCDYKRLQDGNLGPNTGGMGCVSPAPFITANDEKEIEDRFIQPLLQELSNAERPFFGVVFAGLMRTVHGFKALEFNARFGDPETQTFLPRVEGDLIPILNAIAQKDEKTFGHLKVNLSNTASVHIVKAAKGYPGLNGEIVEKGKALVPTASPTGIWNLAGVSAESKTSGGRVLGLTALGKNFAEARANAYRSIGELKFENEFYRRDIADPLPENLAFFASGQGSNVQNLLSYLKENQTRFIPRIIITDQETCGLRAQTEVPCVYIPRGKKSKQEHEQEILEVLQNAKIDRIFLGGYMRIFSPEFISKFSKGEENKIINIHPSLLPHFKGKDAFKDAYAADVKTSGITIHAVDSGIDTGPILMQLSFPKLATDHFETFYQRGRNLEKAIYLQFLELFNSARKRNLKCVTLPKELGTNASGSVYWIQDHGVQSGTKDYFKRIANLVSDPISEMCFIFEDGILIYPSSGNTDNKPLSVLQKFQSVCEVSFLAGVTDNPALVLREALDLEFSDCGAKLQGSVHSGTIHFFKEEPKPEQTQTLFNNLVQSQKASLLDKWLNKQTDDWTNEKSPTEPTNTELNSNLIQTFNPTAGLSQWHEWNEQNCWALSTEEIETICGYFQKPEVLEDRKRSGLPDFPTDLEIEVLAQSWSEHCKHKIFAADITVEDENGSRTISSLYKTFIQGATRAVREKLAAKNRDYLVSVFEDNAGIVDFDENFYLCMKVETHNSPSALDPYGGALTGILGVNRDVLGTGLGAKPIANTDVFCVGDPNAQQELEKKKLYPKKLLSPLRILKGIHHGVQDGGNKSGIPTVNGSIRFDASYLGKPLVFCGTVGLIPKRGPDPKKLAFKHHQSGDKIVIIGGRTGKDGIHGATFSSLQLNATFSAGVVQIGDPFTQKRVLDLVLEARDRDLISGITDNGAGGFSSSIGEMAERTGGARIDLELAPLKYPGLLPWQILVSESQERMSLAVKPENLDAFLALAESRSVEATVLGEFNTNGAFEVFYGDKPVGRLPLSFLHKGNPKLKLTAKKANGGIQDAKEKLFLENLPAVSAKHSFETLAKSILSHPQIASKESWLRSYDHEVQGATLLRPFEGSKGQTPTDAGLVTLENHGGKAGNGIVISHGLMPELSLYSAREAALHAFDEAVRNAICAGGNPDYFSVLDNFCWPDPIASQKNPDGAHKLYQLVETCQALNDISIQYEMPFISGKDSMKNDFSGIAPDGREIKISSLPTVLISLMGRNDCTSQRITSVLQNADQVYVISPYLNQMNNQVRVPSLARTFGSQGPIPLNPETSRAFYGRFFNYLRKEKIRTCHDVSEGGIFPSVVEMLDSVQQGLNLISKPESFWFHELPSAFMVSAANLDSAKAEFGDDALFLGTVTSDGMVSIQNQFSASSADLLKHFQFGIRNWRNEAGVSP